MAKRPGGFGLALPARDPAAPAYRWLYGALRAAILDGQLRPGARLPSTRDLAVQYHLARGTIVAAFAQLTAEGYVDGTVGSGTYVSAVLPDALLHVEARAGARTAPRPRPRHLSRYAGRVRPFPPLEIRPSRAFRPNVPALDQFPIALWTQLAARRLRRASTSLLLGCDGLGYPPLRAAVADYLATSRGVSCHPDQVFIVAGVQEALDLVARILLDPGDRVGLEDPGYMGAKIIFDAAGARVLSVPVDDEGAILRPSSLRGARLVYLTPAHQCPLGVVASLPRRLAWLEWAQSTGAFLFEDDYDSEYRYSGRPIPALQGLDRAGQVIFAGSFSKVLFPSLRLGYLVVPPDLVDPFTAARTQIHRHRPLLEQTILSDFITEGHFGRHLRRMRQLYAERLSVLLEGAQQHLAGLLDLSPIEAGLQTIGFLAGGISDVAAAESARARGVEVTALHRYYRSPMPRDGLILGFATIPPRDIRRGVVDLAHALTPLASRPRARRPRRTASR